MKRSMVDLLAALRRYLVAPVVLCLVLAGCASVPPLDEATLLDIRLASPDDIERRQQTSEQYERETFVGLSLSIPEGKKYSFAADQYDEYMAFLNANPSFDYRPRPPMIDWPVIRLQFRSGQNLAEEPDTPWDLRFWDCSQKDEMARVGAALVIWRGRALTPHDRHSGPYATAISQAPQDYEVVFTYRRWNPRAERPADTIKLLPLADDLCVGFTESNWPIARPTVGRPLRINGELVNRLIGDLPRMLPIRRDSSTEPARAP